MSPATPGPSRRALLAGALASSLTGSAAGRAAAAASDGPRVVSLDWAQTSTLIALGHPPVGAAETGLYGRWVGEPALPPDVRDVGLRGQPNLEWVAALKPDLILMSPLGEPARPALERIAPVRQTSPFTPERRPLAGTAALTLDLGRRIGRGAQAQALIARSEADFAAARTALARGGAQAQGEARGVLLVSFLDARHLLVFGAGSLFGDVLAKVGRRNAWDRPTSVWGTSRVGIAALADLPDADLAIIEPVPAPAREALTRPGLWTNLAGLRTGRTATLPAAWIFGDLVAAGRFAGLLADAWGGPHPSDAPARDADAATR